MKSHKLYLLLILLSAIPVFGFGQTKSISNAYIAQQFSDYENKDASLNHHNFFERMAAKMHLSEQAEMVLSAKLEGKNGFVHYKYKQHYSGIPVFGNTYILHEKNGVIANAGGHYSPQVPKVARPSFDGNTALAKAKQAMGATKYAEKNPAPVLCFIDPAFPNASEVLLLAYQVDLRIITPFDKRRLFVDALSGKLIANFPLILQEGVPSKAKTKYYGTRDIITDSLGPQNFLLHDPTRGQGITVTDVSGNNFTNSNSNWDLTNDNKDEVALDAHFCSQEYYDLLLEQFNWQGLDNHGKALEVRVHDNGAGNVNAYWDGQSTNYGDGDCLYGPLTTLEVVGHEFTHGVIDYTSNLVYSGESGAINESLADMFGKILERNVDPGNFSWVLSHSFLLSPDAAPFRIMNDPASVDMPDYYLGSLWDTGADVHTNSSIGNLWFSMIVDGKQGVNEAGTPYNVPAIGITKAGQIVFKTNNAYFTENSNYPEFALYSVEAAEELYGAGSAEALAVVEAWKAVGVAGAPPSSVLNLSLGASFNFFQECGVNEFVPITVQIVNQGGVAYLPSMNAILTISEGTGSLPDYNMPITQTLAPGEMLDITIDDWFMPNDVGYYFLDINLLLSDNNDGDNYGFYFYDIGSQANDLELSAYIEPQPCFVTEANAIFYLFNNSCSALDAGTNVTIEAEDINGQVIWSMPYTFTQDLQGFQNVLVETPLSLVGAPDYSVFTLNFAQDVNLDNNYTYASIGTSTTISTDYLNDFNSDLTTDNTLYVNSIQDSPLVVYSGESYFGSTGYASDPEEFVSCPNYIDNFNSEYNGVNSTIKACVDFSTAQSPLLEFDIVLFKNQFAVNNNYPYSSMLQASWQGTGSGSDVIYDQQDGIEKHYSYALPPNFKGEIEFKFYTEVGEYVVDPANFDSDDFVLMDNLQLRRNATATYDPAQNDFVLLSPNPTQGFATIKSSIPMKQLKLYDISGHLLLESAVNNSLFDLNIQDQQNGFYLLNIELENGQMVVGKMVKME